MPTRSIDLVQGRSLYERMCASCHGTSGSGSAAPVGAPAGTPPPPAIGQRSIMHEVTPALTYRIVSVGIQGTAMVGWSAQLTPDERWDVVSYVNSLRATDAARARGASLLKKLCADCGNDVPARTFAWQTERSDAQLAGMIRAGDPATGMLASVPVTEVDADALVAALRGMAVVMPASAAAQADGSSDPRTAARTVLRMLDDAVLAARTGRQTDAADLAFDAYIAFEPLETNVRMRDPGLVAQLERQFAEFTARSRPVTLPQPTPTDWPSSRQCPPCSNLPRRRRHRGAAFSNRSSSSCAKGLRRFSSLAPSWHF